MWAGMEGCGQTAGCSDPTAGGSLPDRLQQAELPVVDYEHCTQPDWWGGLAIRQTMICAGGAEKAGCNVGTAPGWREHIPGSQWC